MATVIRLAKHGKKKRPFYRIVVADSRSPRDGRNIEQIGHYDPVKGKNELTVKRDRLEYWLGTGAQMSVSLRSRIKEKMKEWQVSPEGKPTEAPKAKPQEKVKDKAT